MKNSGPFNNFNLFHMNLWYTWLYCLNMFFAAEVPSNCFLLRGSRYQQLHLLYNICHEPDQKLDLQRPCRLHFLMNTVCLSQVWNQSVALQLILNISVSFHRDQFRLTFDYRVSFDPGMHAMDVCMIGVLQPFQHHRSY